MKSISSPKRRGNVLPVVLLLLPLTSGCGGQAKGTINGKVTYQDKPLSSGTVTFVPETGSPEYSEIQSDGSYRMKNAPLGPVKIGVQRKSGQETLKSSGMPRNPKDYGKLREAIAENGNLPPKYADPNKSGLTYTVTKGTQQHDIDLK